MNNREPPKKYEGPPTKRFFDALKDADPEDVIRRIQEGDIRTLVIGLLMRAGTTLFQSQEACLQFEAVIAQSNAVRDPARFQSGDTFSQDVDALREGTIDRLREIARAAPAAIGAILTSSRRSKRPPA